MTNPKVLPGPARGGVRDEAGPDSQLVNKGHTILPRTVIAQVYGHAGPVIQGAAQTAAPHRWAYTHEVDVGRLRLRLRQEADEERLESASILGDVTRIGAMLQAQPRDEEPALGLLMCPQAVHQEVE